MENESVYYSKDNSVTPQGASIGEENGIWTRVERKVRVNDMALEPWENAGGYDGTIKAYLKKRFLKETLAVIIFDVFFLVVGLMGLVVAFMILDDYVLGFVLVVAMGFAISSLTNNIAERRVNRMTLDNQEYQLCSVEAFNFDYRTPEKVCYVKDMAGTVLMTQTAGSEPVPMKVIYHAYMSEKECTGKLLRVKNGNHGYLYVMFPDTYLVEDEK